jgi:hypothetical protein
MPIFVIIAQKGQNSVRLPAAIVEQFAEKYLQIQEDVWLVAANGTARQLSDKLLITKGENGSAVVVEVASYFGRANNDIWSWIKSNWESTADG